jgi:hypothetical protein
MEASLSSSASSIADLESRLSALNPEYTEVLNHDHTTAGLVEIVKQVDDAKRQIQEIDRLYESRVNIGKEKFGLIKRKFRELRRKSQVFVNSQLPLYDAFQESVEEDEPIEELFRQAVNVSRNGDFNTSQLLATAAGDLLHEIEVFKVNPLTIFMITLTFFFQAGIEMEHEKMSWIFPLIGGISSCIIGVAIAVIAPWALPLELGIVCGTFAIGAIFGGAVNIFRGYKVQQTAEALGILKSQALILYDNTVKLNITFNELSQKYQVLKIQGGFDENFENFEIDAPVVRRFVASLKKNTPAIIVNLKKLQAIAIGLEFLEEWP